MALGHNWTETCIRYYFRDICTECFSGVCITAMLNGQAEMLATMQNYPNLRLVEASVEDIQLCEETPSGSEQSEETQNRSARVQGVITKEGGLIEAGRVVITTGTFLRGSFNIA